MIKFYDENAPKLLMPARWQDIVAGAAMVYNGDGTFTHTFTGGANVCIIGAPNPVMHGMLYVLEHFARAEMLLLANKRPPFETLNIAEWSKAPNISELETRLMSAHKILPMPPTEKDDNNAPPLNKMRWYLERKKRRRK